MSNKDICSPDSVFLNRINFLFLFIFSRNAPSTSCTSIRLLKSHTKAIFVDILISNATDGILSLTAKNAVVPCRLTQSYTTSGVVVHRLESSVLTSSKVSVRIFLKARFGLNSG